MFGNREIMELIEQINEDLKEMKLIVKTRKIPGFGEIDLDGEVFETVDEMVDAMKYGKKGTFVL